MIEIVKITEQVTAWQHLICLPRVLSCGVPVVYIFHEFLTHQFEFIEAQLVLLWLSGKLCYMSRTTRLARDYIALDRLFENTKIKVGVIKAGPNLPDNEDINIPGKCVHVIARRFSLSVFLFFCMTQVPADCSRIQRYFGLHDDSTKWNRWSSCFLASVLFVSNNNWSCYWNEWVGEIYSIEHQSWVTTQCVTSPLCLTEASQVHRWIWCGTDGKLES